MKKHSDFDEKWVQELVASDPTILGLGKLVVIAKEKQQPSGGKLDLLLEDTETDRRYEVELQLGATDPSHIMRTIEYWDIEKRRYPQYDHCAVLVAEDITSRFLNVIRLFNGTLPFVAIQMQAVSVDGRMTLVFTRVVDELSRGVDDSDPPPPADRAYWEDVRGSKESMLLVDHMLNTLQGINPDLSLNYTKSYVGVAKDGGAFNFVRFVPTKKHVRFLVHLPKTDENDAAFEDANLDMLDYKRTHGGFYRVRLKKGDNSHNNDGLKQLVRQAYEQKVSA